MVISPLPAKRPGSGLFFGARRIPVDENSGEKKNPARTARAVLQKFYQYIGQKLDRDGNGELVKEMVKLVQMERDLSGAGKDGTKVKVQWESGKKKE